jgi:hypothetical protein
MKEKAKTPDLKELKVSDLVSLMQKVLVGFTHKPDCAFLKMQGVCSCGLDQLRKDTAATIQSMIDGTLDAKKKL